LPEIYDYVGSRREVKKWSSVPIGSPWDRMKPLGPHTIIQRTEKRQEQEFRMAQKRGGFAGLGKIHSVCHLLYLWYLARLI
jgi:hypothetical protein